MPIIVTVNHRSNLIRMFTFVAFSLSSLNDGSTIMSFNFYWLSAYQKYFVSPKIVPGIEFDILKPELTYKIFLSLSLALTLTAYIRYSSILFNQGVKVNIDRQIFNHGYLTENKTSVMLLFKPIFCSHIHTHSQTHTHTHTHTRVCVCVSVFT